jgi:hypothetical protein
VLFYQCLQTYFCLGWLLLCYFVFDFPFLISETTGFASLNAHRFFKGRFVFAHIAFQGQPGIRLFENIPGGAGSPTEGAERVFFTGDGMDLPTVALSLGVVTGIYRHILVGEFVAEDVDARPRRIDGAVFRYGVEG